MKFKYNDKVRVIKDDENDGFYIGLVGVVKFFEKSGSIYDKLTSAISDKPKPNVYALQIDGEGRLFYVTEDDLEIIVD